MINFSFSWFCHLKEVGRPHVTCFMSLSLFDSPSLISCVPPLGHRYLQVNFHGWPSFFRFNLDFKWQPCDINLSHCLKHSMLGLHMHAAKVSASTAGLWNLENDQFLLSLLQTRVACDGCLSWLQSMSICRGYNGTLVNRPRPQPIAPGPLEPGLMKREDEKMPHFQCIPSGSSVLESGQWF